MKEFIHYEESDFFDDKKASRKERKLASKLDRSKYKKTDLEKQKKEQHFEDEHVQSGIVASIKGQEVLVISENATFSCTVRGSLKKDKERSKTLVIVGDKVLFDSDNAIVSIQERSSILSRADHLSQQKEHLIAANVDQVLITVSVIDPKLRPSIIDRYLIAAEKGDLHPVIICNKKDLLDNPSYTEQEREIEKEILNECIEAYRQAGVLFFPISCETGEGVDAVKEQMKGKISVFSGQSGTGKSSLINALCGLSLKVGRTVQSSRKGAHTTSYAELIPLPFGGYVVDTPGIKSFGVWNLQKEELRHLFSEIAEAGLGCKFQDCFHRGEAGCAIPEAIEKGQVSQLRYESYLSILESIESEHLRR
jgi:ribosome biogenesis GTPase / thiamine phosphate phosphatase